MMGLFNEAAAILRLIDGFSGSGKTKGDVPNFQQVRRWKRTARRARRSAGVAR